MNNLAHAETQFRKAADDVAAALEDMLRQAVERTAAANPGKPVSGTSAMGTWCLFVGDERDSRNPQCFRAFDRIQSEYGWSAIPAPVAFRTDGRGPIERLTDW